MAKTIYIKLKSSSIGAGPFVISNGIDTIYDDSVSRNELIAGRAYLVEDDVQVIVIESIGKCKTKRNFSIGTTYPSEIANTTYIPTRNACVWRHLRNLSIYPAYFLYNFIINVPITYSY